jgi:ubiquitin-conjugating enzyme E2 A
MANFRICNEINNLKKESPIGISISVEDDILNWDAIIMGPDDSPWEGGIFQLKITIDNEYPHKAPYIRFLTPIFHPNIYKNGNICLDILQNKWSPVYDIKSVLISIQSLLTDPNTDSPANTEAANMYVNNRKEYNKRIRSMIE